MPRYLTAYHAIFIGLTGASLLAFGLHVSLAAELDSERASDPMQFARGAKAWAENCGRCHNLRAPEELTDEDWDVTVTHMRVRGNLPGALARDIAAFLKASN